MAIPQAMTFQKDIANQDVQKVYEFCDEIDEVEEMAKLKPAIVPSFGGEITDKENIFVSEKL